jgi:cell division protein FtsB
MAQVIHAAGVIGPEYALGHGKVAASGAVALAAWRFIRRASIAFMSRPAVSPKFNVLELLLTVLLAIGSLQLVALLGLATVRQLNWQEDLVKLQQQHQQTEREIKGLRERAKRATNDPLYLEQLARQQGMVRKDEVVQMPSAANQETATPNSPSRP